MPVEDGEWEEDFESPIEIEIETDEEANLSPDSFGPEGVEPSAPTTEPHAESLVEMSDSSGANDDAGPLPEFDPKVRQDFEGLLYLGRLTDTFEWLGHRFVIRTLTTGEIIEVGLLHKAYVGSIADVKAYQAAVVAACVVSVDGKPLPMPLTNDKTDTSLVNRFEYVMRSWFPPTLDAIYERYRLLEARVDEVIAAMGKA